MIVGSIADAYDRRPCKDFARSLSSSCLPKRYTRVLICRFFSRPSESFLLGVTTIPVMTRFRFLDMNIVFELFSVSRGELRVLRSSFSPDRSFERMLGRLVEK